MEAAGRWALIEDGRTAGRQDGRDGSPGTPDDRGQPIEAFAWTLLRRYGVVFRKLLAREPLAPSWRELILFYRRLEAREKSAAAGL